MREELDTSDMEYADFAVRHQSILMAVARNICGGNTTACDDLVQDVLLRALLKWDSLRSWSEPERRAWLVRVLHNRFLDTCRRSRTEATTVINLGNVHKLFEEPEAPDPELWECVTEAELIKAVATLPFNLRRTFELHSEGLRHAEIGRRLGAPVGTVGTWLYHARLKLRDQLRDMAEARRKLGSG
ncbi:RNA polymerase sigma factor [Corallococcus aberystwythensis]|uniref:RNA polymerase sigma factor n=1 Tax=Corallococcus aberystwythensis TaxID=2316722 RepID=A0A3A8QBX7_9BACT|nr:RNA polymerase sigma factor [Corallococcus aberystwythensis]RKH65648.1 RNA polymerase sigma factor [Corallococcus aberystwythensis]